MVVPALWDLLQLPKIDNEYHRLFLIQHPYGAIVQWYQEFEAKFSDLVKFVPSIGKSYEGRDLPAVHITAPESPSDSPKIYFQCQIHASMQSN